MHPDTKRMFDHLFTFLPKSFTLADYARIVQVPIPEAEHDCQAAVEAGLLTYDGEGYYQEAQ